MILIIDNYDSFTYNLVDIVAKRTEVVVKYPDDVDIFKLTNISAIIISPGPGHPLDNNLLIKLIEYFENKPILGVCLGAQALTCYYGGEVIQGTKIMHGKVDDLKIISSTPLYQELPSKFKIMRYHSLISNPNQFPKELEITGRTEDCIQSFQHRDRQHYGIQYHPESFATENGEQIINNFIKIATRGN
ncbi:MULTISPECIES: anthranilate synthase component II [Staphylococcus]|uniref:anthranilate synthase component II n=1 Tax=Staphylococcus TaxID=1279 RepID=UPI000CD0DB6A|nr:MULTISPECIES: aminodeoxychorismate/anthranilate synthase component II [Staphylococcus]POA04011.1 glutamine amidotransferase [Staphylococcus caprae]SUL95640.1 anthranilate synthase component II [Staphylococcus caprae]HCG75736.1 aminodeoxychorismate/anthranilate synthase component II [Staphylococcus sp.]